MLGDTTNNHNELMLHLPIMDIYREVVKAYVSHTAQAWELSYDSASKLADAAMQIYSHLCNTPLNSHPLRIGCFGKKFATQVDFVLQGREAASLGHAPIGNLEILFEHLAMTIALGQVDGFYTTLEKNNTTRLTILKEKSYSESLFQIRPVQITAPVESVRLAKPEEISILVQLACVKYPANVLPLNFRYPEKLVDQARNGDIHALIAVCHDGQIAGSIIWSNLNPKIVSCCGPFLYVQDSSLASNLVESLLHHLAKHHAVCIINTDPTPDLQTQEWEVAGRFSVFRNGINSPKTWYIRLLVEDFGTNVYITEEVESFLRSEYHRLALPRQLSLVVTKDNQQASVLAAEFRRDEEKVILRPLVSGKDIPVILSQHLQILKRQAINNIFFEVDLGNPSQLPYIKPLLDSHFSPILIIPNAGDGDLLLFQFQADLV